MEIILLERIHRLGNTGDIVKVKNGFARNFLLPLAKALRATDANKKVFEAKRSEIEAKNAKSKAAAETVAAKLEGLAVTLTRQSSEEGKLFGSVTVRDIGEALASAGHDVPKSQIIVSGSIKNIGVYPVKLLLHPEVTATVNLNVIRNEAEAA